MRKTCLTALVLLAATAVVADDKPAKTDRDALQGAWVAESYEAQNQKLAGDDLKMVTVEVKGDEWTVHLGTQVNKGKHKLDPAKSPKQFDGTITDGPAEGQALLGIYKIDGDTWTQCWADPGKDRPTEFKADADKGH